MSTSLRSSADVRAVLDARRRASGEALVLHVRPRGDDGAGRSAVVAGKRVGGAVQRNRAKRRLRALLREQPPERGCDVVLVAKAPAVRAPFAQLRAEHGRLRTRLVPGRPRSSAAPAALVVTAAPSTDVDLAIPAPGGTPGAGG